MGRSPSSPSAAASSALPSYFPSTSPSSAAPSPSSSPSSSSRTTSRASSLRWKASSYRAASSSSSMNTILGQLAEGVRVRRMVRHSQDEPLTGLDQAVLLGVVAPRPVGQDEPE